MLKGTNHRVIVVKSPDKHYFEEAIFVVRDDLLREKGATAAAVLLEAGKVANSYMRRLKPVSAKPPKESRRRALSRLPAPLIAAAGAAATGLAWLTAHLVGL
ncbi:MAG: translation initiation factor 2 [Oscillospiraceae bacterium]|nr:translation initiation factor 2 [Oscillospiraceae bacterium]